MANITFSEGSGLADSIFGKSQAPIRRFIEQRAEAREAMSMVPELFDVSTSKRWAEKFTSLTAMDGFKPVGENGAYPVDGMQEGFSKTLEHEVWKDSFTISREMVDDARLVDLKHRPDNFIQAYYRTRERFGAALYAAAMKKQNSFSFEGKSFDAKCADGKPLFDKTHPSRVKGGSQSNLFADSFSNAALGALETAMQNFRGDNGEILDVAPDTILIPNDGALKSAVFAAIGADKSPDTSNNGFNYNYGRWTVIVWPQLLEFLGAGSAPWVLLDSRYNKSYGGAVWLDRKPLEVHSHVDNGNDANVWQGYARFIAGFVDWRFAACAGVTGGDTLISA